MAAQFMMSGRRLGRRAFLRRTALAAGPLILPSGVLGIQGRAGASERVVTGHLGLGYRGRILLERLGESAAAICDVDTVQLERAAPLAGAGARQYRDYREVLERTDIDAIVIATPDHWHGLQVVHACEAGKDVYVETPACATLDDARRMLEAARRFDCIVQVGAPGPLTRAGRAARAAVQAGHVGKVTQVTGWGQRNPEGGDLSRNGPPPAELDWDTWLGPARWVAYNPDRVHGNFRWLLDFGGGQICHQADHCFAMALAAGMRVADPGKGTGLEAPATVHVEAQGAVPTAGLWDCPVDLRVEYRLEPGGPSVAWRQGPPRRDAAFGVEMSGSGGSVFVSTCDERAATEEKVLLAAGTAASEMQEDVLENWLRCIATRETPEMDLERGTFAATLCILGNLAYRLGRPLDWDLRAQRFVNDSLADRLIARPARGQYHL